MARSAAEKLVSKGLITQEQYAKMLSDIKNVETNQGKTEKARKMLRDVLIGVGVLSMTGGTAVMRHL